MTAVELGVCQADSFTATTTVVDEVINRFSSNSPTEENVHIVPYFEWKSYFKFGCRACSNPTFEVVDASG